MFHNCRGPILLAIVVASAAGAGVATTFGPGSGEHGGAFQRATGGIGLFAAVAPAWSFFTLDPRIENCCENELWPVPGIPCYSPYHGALIADPPPLERGRFDH